MCYATFVYEINLGNGVVLVTGHHRIVVATELLTRREALNGTQAGGVEGVVDTEQTPCVAECVHVAAASLLECIGQQGAEGAVGVRGGHRVEVATEHYRMLGLPDALTEAIHLEGSLHQVAMQGLGSFLCSLYLLTCIAIIHLASPRSASLRDTGGLQVAVEEGNGSPWGFYIDHHAAVGCFREE